MPEGWGSAQELSKDASCLEQLQPDPRTAWEPPCTTELGPQGRAPGELL